jgi:hypothetical protein
LLKPNYPSDLQSSEISDDMGLRNIEEKLKRETALREKGANLALQELESMISSIKSLNEQLKTIEKKFGSELRSNPALLEKITAIREELGLPTELGIFEKKEKPGLLDKLTSGGFYDQLALQILDIGKNSMKDTGGVMSFSELIKRIQELYKGHIISINDIQKSLSVLEKNNLLAKIELLDSGFKIIHFVTQELSPDMHEILKLANKFGGQLSRERIILETGWVLDRITRVMNYLEDKHITVKEENLEGITYYFPSI